MADFTKAFSASSNVRGGYSVTSEGAEVYDGIDRGFHPSWDGWQIVDALKFAASDETEFQSTLAQNKKLREKVRTLFKNIYWDRFLGDLIPDQEIAAELFESSLELGVERAVNCLQVSLNLLNAGRTDRFDVVEDGRPGKQTLDSLENCLKTEAPASLINMMRMLQALHYIGRIRKNPRQDLIAKERLGRFRVVRQSERIKPASPTGLRLED